MADVIVRVAHFERCKLAQEAIRTRMLLFLQAHIEAADRVAKDFRCLPRFPDGRKVSSLLDHFDFKFQLLNHFFPFLVEFHLVRSNFGESVAANGHATTRVIVKGQTNVLLICGGNQAELQTRVLEPTRRRTCRLPEHLRKRVLYLYTRLLKRNYPTRDPNFRSRLNVSLDQLSKLS